MIDRKLVKKIVAAGIIGGILIFTGIQFIPVERTNPPVTKDIDANDDTKAILRRACYNCHSNETVWPWYSYVAPVSWLVVNDVHTARGRFNFSEWDTFDEDYQIYLIGSMLEKVERGEMPPGKYLTMHPNAKITEQELNVLKKWNESVLQ